MKNIIILLAALLTAHTLSCCKKEDPKPEPDPNVADHMTAIINGEEWEANCEPSWPGLGCRKVNCQYYVDTKGFEIIAGGDFLTIAFSKNSGGGIDTGANTLPFRRKVIICSQPKCGEISKIFDMDTTFLNQLFILGIDDDDKIIEGEFNFRAVSEDKTDTILIESGYFRTNYRP